MSTKKEMLVEMRLTEDELIETTEQLDGILERAKYAQRTLNAQDDPGAAEVVRNALKAQLKDLFGDL